MLTRVVPVAAAIAVACALAPVGDAAGTTTTVPAAAGVNQYVETLPSAGGGVPSGSATTPTGGSRTHRAAARAGGGGGIGLAGWLAILIGAIAATTGAGLLLRRRWAGGASRAHADG